MINLVTNLLWVEGGFIVVMLIVATIFSLYYYRPALYVVAAALLFSLYFFRNVDRVCPQALNDTSVIISPADGKVVDIEYDAQRANGYPHKISIFLSPFDVHVNWTPCAGVVQDVSYKPGTFMFAFLPKSSELNERNDVTILCDNGSTIMMRQIAGTIARKICCWVHAGDVVAAGQKYGMIRFGSRVDIFLPEQVDIEVGIGQTMRGGQTVLARFVTV